ncbi:MAG: hypothetical protein BEN18_00465 [Epulopiscium sp. Nuni2H_MBin001]|nr:MAG: hypothetical protein BEN18_00465 [Epulopiscium sp. Nuni2H_MBin001]
MFHYFYDQDKYPKVQGSISAQRLEKIINKYNIISAKEWMEKYETKSLKEDELFISLDDGLKEQLDIALPVLQKYNLTALWNINTNPTKGGIDNLDLYRYFRNYCFATVEEFYQQFFYTVSVGVTNCDNIDIGDYLCNSPFYSYDDKKFRYVRDVILGKDYNKVMDNMIQQYGLDPYMLDLWIGEKDIQQLSQTGHVIGLHTHNHPTNMDGLTKIEQYEELYLNKKILDKITNTNIIAAAYPCGKYNEDTIDVLIDLGVKYAFLCYENDYTKNCDRYTLGRLDCSNVKL